MRVRDLGLSIVLAAAAAVAQPAAANTPAECISLWSGLAKTSRTQGIAQQDFMAACLAHKVTAFQPTVPTPDGAPAGATGRCRDGMYTTASVPFAGCQPHGGLTGLLRP